METSDAWTGGSFRKPAGLRWLVMLDDLGAGDAIAQGSTSVGARQTDFDADSGAIGAVVQYYQTTGTTFSKYGRPL